MIPPRASDITLRVLTSKRLVTSNLAQAVEEAGKHLRDLRAAEVAEQDLVIENGKVVAYRTKLKVSTKYQGTS